MLLPVKFHAKILAKSTGETLQSHINNMELCFDSIVSSNLFFSKFKGKDFLIEMIKFGILFHDIGKISTGFQKMLENHKEKWNYRHEIVSVAFLLIVDNTDFSNLFKSRCQSNFKYRYLKYLTFLAIATHHKTISYLSQYYNTSTNVAMKRLKKIFKEFQDKQNLQFLWELYNNIDDIYKQNIDENQIKSLKDVKDFPRNFYNEIIKPWKNQFGNENFLWDWNKFDFKKYLKFNLNSDNELFFTGFLIRAFIIASDHLSSANIKKIEILNQSFHSLFQKKKPDWKKNGIQETASKKCSSQFLFAPTAYGKTEASLFWADNCLSDYRGERIFFVLPFTASCNKMFARLSEYFGEEKVGIIHSKANSFIYQFFANSDEEYKDIKDIAKKKHDLSKKIYNPLKVITPFQILKLFFGFPFFEINLLEFLNAKIIFDEIHVYEPKIMAQIITSIKFLKTCFNAQFFIMTATIPKFLLKEFLTALDIPDIEKANYIISVQDKELKLRKRHKLKLFNGKLLIDNGKLDSLNSEISELIEVDIRSKKKILIICNTIKTAKKVFSEISKEFIENKRILQCDQIGLIHGELTIKDRNLVEEQIDSFKVLIGTQAIEVSLDIDYNVGYFEICPIDALIQRAGRINRTNKRKYPERIMVLDKDSFDGNNIYSSERIQKTLEYLENKGIGYEDFKSISDYDYNMMVEQVYEAGYNGKEQKDFDETKQRFEQFISKYLKPFDADKTLFKEYEKLFDSITVLPEQYIKNYTYDFQNKNFFNAMNYTLSISKRKYGYYKKYQKVFYNNDLKIHILKITYIEKYGLSAF